MVKLASSAAVPQGGLLLRFMLVAHCLHLLCSHRFYGDLAQHGVVAALIELCKDPDRAARKFACFAIGNAGEPRLPKRTFLSRSALHCIQLMRATVQGTGVPPT